MAAASHVLIPPQDDFAVAARFWASVAFIWFISTFVVISFVSLWAFCPFNFDFKCITGTGRMIFGFLLLGISKIYRRYIRFQ